MEPGVVDLPGQRGAVVLDSLVESLQPQEQGAAGARGTGVFGITGEGRAIVLQCTLLVAGLLERVAQVVVELGDLRADLHALAQHVEAFVLAAERPQGHAEIRPAGARLRMPLQDGPVRVDGRRELAVGMQLCGAPDEKAHVHGQVRGTPARQKKSRPARAGRLSMFAPQGGRAATLPASCGSD